MIDVDTAYKLTEAYDQQYYSVDSITLGELYEDGIVDWTADEWQFPKYTDEQHARLCEKITEHYYERDISVLPVLSWRREFIRYMKEIMPKYIQLYRYLDEFDGQITATSEYYKSRNIVSDFPQTQLSGNQDYASMGTDHQYERIHNISPVDMAAKLKDYDDVDYMIIKDLESMFSCLLTVNTNAW